MSASNRNTGLVDYYKILGVERTASPTDITESFQKKSLVLLAHANDPDKNAELNQLLEAYKIVSNPQLRAEHDRVLGVNEAKSEIQATSETLAEKKWQSLIKLQETLDSLDHTDFYEHRLNGLDKHVADFIRKRDVSLAPDKDSFIRLIQFLNENYSPDNRAEAFSCIIRASRAHEMTDDERYWIALQCLAREPALLDLLLAWPKSREHLLGEFDGVSPLSPEKVNFLTAIIEKPEFVVKFIHFKNDPNDTMSIEEQETIKKNQESYADMILSVFARMGISVDARGRSYAAELLAMTWKPQYASSFWGAFPKGTLDKAAKTMGNVTTQEIKLDNDRRDTKLSDTWSTWSKEEKRVIDLLEQYRKPGVLRFFRSDDAASCRAEVFYHLLTSDTLSPIAKRIAVENLQGENSALSRSLDTMNRSWRGHNSKGCHLKDFIKTKGKPVPVKQIKEFSESLNTACAKAINAKNKDFHAICAPLAAELQALGALLDPPRPSPEARK